VCVQVQHDHVDELTENLRSARADTSSLQERLQEQEARYAELQHTNSQLQGELQDVCHSLERTQMDLGRTQQELAQSASFVEELQAEAAASGAQSASLMEEMQADAAASGATASQLLQQSEQECENLRRCLAENENHARQLMEDREARVEQVCSWWMPGRCT
jgi:predicted  nucleic acid-binding Zn-ribbon protein